MKCQIWRIRTAKIKRNFLVENKNLKNNVFNKNKILRDYDKEPLIIKNYERLFTILIRSGCVLSVMISAYLVSVATLFLPNNDKVSIGFLIIFALIFIVIMRVIFSHCSAFDDKICFYQNSIVFYRNGVQERQIHNSTIKENIIKPFWGSGLNDRIWNAVIGIVYFLIIITDYFTDIRIFLFMIFIFVGNFILKLFYFFYINHNFKNFTLFPAILANTPQIIREKGFFYPKLRNYLICVSDKEYNEIKKWFLIQNIDIQNLKKFYFN